MFFYRSVLHIDLPCIHYRLINKQGQDLRLDTHVYAQFQKKTSLSLLFIVYLHVTQWLVNQACTATRGIRHMLSTKRCTCHYKTYKNEKSPVLTPIIPSVLNSWEHNFKAVLYVYQEETTSKLKDQYKVRNHTECFINNSVETIYAQ